MRVLYSCIIWATTLSWNTGSVEAVDYGQAVLDWVKKEGGFIHPDISFRIDEHAYGVFATKAIKKSEKILSLPRSVLFTAPPDDDKDDHEITCDTAKLLQKELETAIANGKSTSYHGPFINFLLSKSTNQIPSGWSEEGKNLLKKVIGKDLPPQDFTFSFAEECGKQFNPDDSEIGNRAFNIVMQRGWDNLLIPVFDMLNHVNGDRLNTDHETVHSDGPVVVTASRDIPVGEEIFTTYSACTDCGNRELNYGVPEMLRDYGFVEGLPQRWAFPFKDEDMKVLVAFDLKDVNGTTELTWKTNGHLQEFPIRILKYNLERLQSFDLDRAAKGVPDDELRTIHSFLSAYTEALRIGVWEAYALDDSNVEDIEYECDVAADGSQNCDTPARDYDDLVGEKLTWHESGYQCYEGRFMDFPEHKHLEWVNSQYQQIQYFQLQSNLDTCFRLDGVIQICGAYRPHYHELVVHNTARYFKDIKRVVFVGGGDSMLLQEILKYPSLEFVVGLEIDQKVTRGAFKHWGSQPHWDNEKVQWWFGDAGKSLLMLPKEYFGSFDMVLVDLSETVTSMLVTDGLDIMTALGFLLQPEGVLVKNELYFGKMNKIFDYTIQIDFEDIPVICAQALSLGSPSRDFLLPTRYDHNIDAVAYRHKGTEDSYDLVHDYMFNKDSDYRGQCVEEGTPEEIPESQTSSPGIMMILEAEDVDPSFLKSTNTLSKAMKQVINGAGLKLLSHVSPLTDEDTNVFVLREGYIGVRCWREHKYCAFDVLLWSSFEKHNTIKVALVSSIKSQLSSAYRIVSGGMFGVSAWQEDEKKRGPRRPTCVTRTDPVGRGQADDDVVSKSILLEGLSYVNASEPVLALIICGEDTTPCQSASVATESDRVRERLVIKDCSRSGMVDCELQSWRAIEDAVLNSGKIGAVILDTKAPKAMAQIIVKIFKSHAHKSNCLEDGLVVVATLMDSSQKWRRAFTHRFLRDVVIYEPQFRGIAEFTGKDKGIEMGLLSTVNTTEFVGSFLKSVENIKAQHDLAAEVRHIGNGLWRYLPDFTPSTFGRAGHYDHTDGLKQWQSQHPLARQTMFQFDVMTFASSPIKVGDFVTADYEGKGQYFPGKVTKTSKGGTFTIAYDDGDVESGVPMNRIRQPGRKVDKAPPSSELKRSLSESVSETFSVKKQNVELLTSAGDGYIIASTWVGGSAIMVYDGRSHIDVNLFSKDSKADLQEKFLESISKKVSGLTLILRDEQPRGFGRVVNYEEDIKQWKVPHWTQPVDDSLFDERKSYYE